MNWHKSSAVALDTILWCPRQTQILYFRFPIRERGPELLFCQMVIPTDDEPVLKSQFQGKDPSDTITLLLSSI